MGTEHDSEPLISPRGDELEGQPLAGGEERPAAASRDVEPGPEVGDPIGAPERGPRPEPSEPLTGSRPRAESPNMLPSRKGRSHVERSFVRVIATGGIVGIGVVIAAIMSSSNSQGWLIGLVVSLVSVVLAAVLWSSRVL